MSLTQERKQEIINQYQVHETDTGSADVQIAMINQKDHASRRGLLKMIGHRRSLLSYVQREDPERYLSLIRSLGIRR
ncbi:MAG: 30S ribosomal protein S15 [Cyanobacteria bacterium SW_11_48_12]|nr:MAG: 30S ribosomal protein S15 [Cyanobacteria bacterium SW_11_48_12]